MPPRLQPITLTSESYRDRRSSRRFCSPVTVAAVGPRLRPSRQPCTRQRPGEIVVCQQAGQYQDRVLIADRQELPERQRGDEQTELGHGAGRVCHKQPRRGSAGPVGVGGYLRARHRARHQPAPTASDSATSSSVSASMIISTSGTRSRSASAPKLSLPLDPKTVRLSPCPSAIADSG